MSTVLERPAVVTPAQPLVPRDARLVAWLAVAAVALRLALFLGRGNYVAFDEAWYLILGHNVWSGHGYTMGGLRQVALSPLFPLAAGGLGRLLGSDVWGGRLVAALASGLLVLPCWSIFRRLAGRRAALLACALVAALPSLAAFVAPELVGWDLWVGAGPLGQLFALTGIGLLLAGLERRPLLRWTFAGGAFALAYLDRPEMLAVAVLATSAALAAAGLRRLQGFVLPVLGCGTALLLVASPYLLYLHGTLATWTLTGRGIDVRPASVQRTAYGGQSEPSATVEQMLWTGDQQRYAAELYELAASDTHMVNGYWGVPPAQVPAVPAVAPRSALAAAAAASGSGSPVSSAALLPSGTASTWPGTASPGIERQPLPPLRPPSRLERVGFYGRALGMLLPWPLWPFALAGLLLPGRRRYRWEVAAFAPLVGTGITIAGLIAIDPRTQLLLAPVFAWYAARGLTLLASRLQRSWARGVRRGFMFYAVGGTALAVLLGIDGHRLWLGAGDLSVRQVIADANREVAGELGRLVPPDEIVRSWSPALGAWSRRDWGPLPMASLPRVLRFADATATRWLVFSTLNPSPLPRSQMPRAFLIVSVPPGASAARAWRIDVFRFADDYAVGRLVPLGSGS